jgi:hypothetical protein
MVEVPGTDTGTVGGADFAPPKLRHPGKWRLLLPLKLIELGKTKKQVMAGCCGALNY